MDKRQEGLLMTNDEVLRRTWADISLDAIDYNFKKIRTAVKGSMVMAIVKADAYGHGDRMTAPFLEEAGADWFGVSLKKLAEYANPELQNRF